MTILKQKKSLQYFGQLVSHISPKNIVKDGADILLIKNNKILLDNRKVANFFNNNFHSITKNLDLRNWPDELKFNIFDKTDIIINKFRSHPSIAKLKQKFGLKESLRLNQL